MDYIIILVDILIVALAITLIKYNQLKQSKKEIEQELTKVNTICRDILYDNCVLADKIYKIRNLNLIDYSNNDYYKELLTVDKY